MVRCDLAYVSKNSKKISSSQGIAVRGAVIVDCVAIYRYATSLQHELSGIYNKSNYNRKLYVAIGATLSMRLSD